MNNLSLLTDTLPDSIQLESGDVLSIRTGCATVLDVIDVMGDDSLPVRTRVAYQLSRMVKDPYQVRDIPEIVKLLQEFVSFHDPDLPKGKPSGKKVLDYWQDARLIVAAFRQAYGIDLTCETLHWWVFCSLLDGIPDSTRLSQVMQIRSSTPRKGATAEERRKLTEAQQQVRVVSRRRGRPAMSFDEQLNLLDI